MDEFLQAPHPGALTKRHEHGIPQAVQRHNATIMAPVLRLRQTCGKRHDDLHAFASMVRSRQAYVQEGAIRYAPHWDSAVVVQCEQQRLLCLVVDAGDGQRGRIEAVRIAQIAEDGRLTRVRAAQRVGREKKVQLTEYLISTPDSRT